MSVGEIRIPRANVFGERNSRWGAVGAAIALVLLVLLVQIRWSPRFAGMGSDSGMFAYVGVRILEGELPYRDVFDTKPPGVFYVNALALFLGGRTPWAIWGLGVLWITLATLILFFTLRACSRLLPAVTATAVFVLTVHHPSYYQGGNLTEVYALLPQVLVLAVAMSYFKRRRAVTLLLAGALTALAILFKPTYSALGLALLAVTSGEALLGRQWKEAAVRIAAFGTGMALPLAGAALPWAAEGALENLWDAVVRFNFVYSSEGFSLVGIYGAFRMLFVDEPLAAVTPLAVGASALFLWNTWRAGAVGEKATTLAGGLRAAVASPATGVVMVGVIALPLEWAMVTVSGRKLGHYILTTLPALSVALSYLICEASRAIRERRLAFHWVVVSAAIAGTLGLSWLVEVAVRELPRPAELAAFWREPFGGSYVADPLVERIIELSDPSQSVFIWADHPDLNFLSGRRAPSRYVFSLHLLLPGTGNSLRFAQLLEDLEDDPPALILTQWQSDIGVPFLGAPREELCLGCPPEVSAGVLQLADYLNRWYTERERVGIWAIYERASG